MKNRSTTACSQGFSLVEVMIALIIICVGMLGIAKLQALVLSNTGASRTRALAALEASSIAASMHANRDYWTGSPAASTIVSSTGVTSSDSNLQTSPQCFYGGSDAPCTTPVKLAAFDLANWQQDMANVLPGATSTIACATNVGVVSCTIVITWQENAVASNAQEGTNPFQTQNYQLVVDP